MQSNAQDANQNVKEKFTDKRGKPSLIIFNEKSAYKNTDSQKVLREQLGLKDNSSYVKIKSENDRIGFLHEKFQQYYQGIKIEFATYSLHSKSGKLESMSGEFYQLDNVNTHPTLSKNQAFNQALQQIGATAYLWESPADAKINNYKKPDGELVLLPIVDEDENGKTTEELRLAYKFDIYATKPVSRGDIYIDAVTGNSLFYNAIIKHVGEFSHGHKSGNTSTIEYHNSSAALVTANAATRYSGTQSIETSPKNGSYILSDVTRGSGVITYNLQNSTSYNSAVDFVDGDNNWIEYDNSKKDNGALDAHWGAEKTYDYWKNVHGRNSYNNSGATIKSYVHYSSNYDNAFWNGSVMTYGDGSGTYFDILTSIDVAGHEIGHAVCSYTADLAYQKESGALNEALSDIWGACIEYYAAPYKQTWLVGEDIERRSGHVALRSMSDPKKEGQPDTYGGTYWVSQKKCRPNSVNDYCGVHTNSGVLNHWFYLLTVGESGSNDNLNSYNISGIGIDKAAKITFRMESIYMTSSSTYSDARNYAIQAAKDIYGINGQPSAEEIAVTNAFYAVGVGSAYSGPVDSTPPAAPTNLVASGTTDTTTELTWDTATDNFGVTGYEIYQGNATTPITTVTGLNYTVTELIPETNYVFYVKAKDAAGNLSVASNNAYVTTSAAIPDNEPPTAPTNLAGTATSSSVNLTWDASTDNIGIKEYEVYQDGASIATVTGTTYNVTGLVAKTSYTFKVNAKDKAGNISEFSNELVISTLSAPYCSSTGTDARFESIEKVELGSFSNSSASTAGYEDFTSKTINVTPGTYTITITPYWPRRKYKEGYSVWIDYNGDGDFTDSGEQVWTYPLSNSSPISGTITIPSSIAVSSTRMRVSMMYNGMPGPCDTFAYGQVEDYTISFGSAPLALTNNTTITESGSDLVIYPNPTDGIINISPSGISESYKVYDRNGFEVQKGKISNGSINVSKLSNGLYFLELSNDNGTIVKTFLKE